MKRVISFVLVFALFSGICVCGAWAADAIDTAEIVRNDGEHETTTGADVLDVWKGNELKFQKLYGGALVTIISTVEQVSDGMTLNGRAYEAAVSLAGGWFVEAEKDNDLLTELSVGDTVKVTGRITDCFMSDRIWLLNSDNAVNVIQLFVPEQTEEEQAKDLMEAAASFMTVYDVNGAFDLLESIGALDAGEYNEEAQSMIEDIRALCYDDTLYLKLEQVVETPPDADSITVEQTDDGYKIDYTFRSWDDMTAANDSYKAYLENNFDYKWQMKDGTLEDEWKEIGNDRVFYDGDGNTMTVEGGMTGDTAYTTLNLIYHDPRI